MFHFSIFVLFLFLSVGLAIPKGEEDEQNYWQRQADANLNTGRHPNSFPYKTIVTFSDFRSGSTAFVDKLNGCKGDMMLEAFGDIVIPTYQHFVQRIKDEGKFLKIQRVEFYRHYPFISYFLKHHHHDRSDVLIVLLERKTVLEQYYSWQNLNDARKHSNELPRNLNLAHSMSPEQKRDLGVAVDPAAYRAYRNLVELYFTDLEELCYYGDLNCVHLYYEDLEAIQDVAGHPLSCHSAVTG